MCKNKTKQNLGRERSVFSEQSHYTKTSPRSYVTLQYKINKLTNNLTSVPSCGTKLCFLRSKRKVGRKCDLTFLIWFQDEFQVSSARNYLTLLPFEISFIASEFQLSFH